MNKGDYDVIGAAIKNISESEYKPSYIILSMRRSKYKNYRLIKRLKAFNFSQIK